MALKGADQKQPTNKNQMNKNQIQQGDVLFKRIEIEIPKNAKRINAKGRGFVFAEGEHTGHAHVADTESDMELIQIGERMLAVVNKSTTIKHEEHKPVTLDPGIWEVGQVVEEDEFGEMQNARD